LLDTISSSLLNGRIDVAGNITLDGSLDVDLLNGFTPATGELFTLMDFTGAETGAFLSINGSDPGAWTVLYDPGNNGQVDLRFDGIGLASVPEPSAWPDIVFFLVLVAVGGRLTQRYAVTHPTSQGKSRCNAALA
jgi:hypothetical protein